MSRLNFDKQQIAHAMITKLNLQFGAGKERNGWYILDGKKILRITMPKGRGILPIGTVNSIRNQSKLSVGEFSDLINCPLSARKYEEIIRRKGFVG